MKYTLVAMTILLAPVAQAYNPIIIEGDAPFDEIVIEMNVEAQKQSYLGILDGYPDLYEFFLPEDSILQITVRQRAEDTAVPVNLILLSIEPETERIKEIVRMNTPIEDRSKKFINSLGINVFENEQLELDLKSGLYRLEVSTPLNESPYELDFGDDSVDNSYFGTFATIWQVQRHFGYWWTQYLFSTYVLYQLGIAVLLIGIWYTWRKRKKISNAS